MKKILTFILTLCGTLVILGCSHSPTDSWKTICIPECGTLKVPEDWYMFEKDDLIYIVDADDHPIMIETHSYCGIDDGQQGPTESNAYFKNITPMKYLSSAILSNSASYGELLVSYEGTQSSKLFLSADLIKFIVWDETVDMEMLLKIAETFVIE